MTDEERTARKREYMREYRKANREKLNQYMRNYFKRPEVKEKRNEYMREHYKAKLENMREYKREYMREYRKRKAAEA